MRRIFWSRRRGLRPSITRYCAVGQLHRAASVGAVATVERFLTFRVNGVNDTEKRNRTALHYACAHGHLGVVTLLLERNCNINACDDDNCTPLLKASQHQPEDCVAVLLQHGADPNAVDALGNTALHYAVLSENTFIASQLLEHSANIEATTKEGFTPLSLALQQNKDQIMELLIEKGGNMHAVFHPDSETIPKKQPNPIRRKSTQSSADDSTEHNSLPRSFCRLCPDGSSRKKDDNNVGTKDEVVLKTSTPRQEASKVRKINLPPDHLQKTSQEQKGKVKCDAGHLPAHSGCLSMKTAGKAQQSKQLNKVLRNKLRTFPESFEKEPPHSISKEKAHLKVEEERKYRLQEPDVGLENPDDRTTCIVASASATAAAVSASVSAESASTSASAASNIASAAFASASAASTSASAAFASASAASRFAASASTSASNASAAAAAASASASNASAAAAAASAVASSNATATVNAVVTAAVSAALAAVTATADHKGYEPSPQRQLGATDDKEFTLKEKEEQDKSETATHLMEMNRSENRNCFPRDSVPTIEKCTAHTSALRQEKQSCAWELYQDGQSPAKNMSKDNHEEMEKLLELDAVGGEKGTEAVPIQDNNTQSRKDVTHSEKSAMRVKKQINSVEDLEGRTPPCVAASDDRELLQLNDEHVLLRNTQAEMEYRDSGCLLGLWDELYLCKRLLEIKDSCGDILRREIKKMETKHGEVHKEVSRITEVLPQLEQEEAEWEELCSLRSSLKQNEGIINDGCCDGKMKTELRGGERQYYEEFGRQLWSPLYPQCCNEEFEVSQHEMFLGNLHLNLKALHNSVTQLQKAGLQENSQREGVLSSARMEHLLWKLEVDCLKLEYSVKNQAEEIEEIENQLLRDLMGDRKKEQNELTQSPQSLTCALEHEMEKIEELEKALQGFIEVLKIAEKKLGECENRELYFYEGMKKRIFEMLQHEINYLKGQWEPIHCKYLDQDINIQLTEQELLKVKIEEENYEHLHKTQGNVEKEVLTLKHLVQETMTQTEEEKILEKVRENNNDSRMSQMILRVKSLESRLPEIKSQVDPTRREMEKHKQLYVEENKSRKLLSNTLSKTVEKLEVSNTKLMWANQQKMTLETILSSLPTQQCPHVTKINSAVGYDPRSSPSDASFPPTSEPQPVLESVRKCLSRRQMGLVKHMTGEAKEDSALLDPWSFEPSPL